MVTSGLPNGEKIGMRKSAAGYGVPHCGWVVLAALLVVGGVAGAVFAAASVARSDAKDSRQAFQRSSGEVASTLQLAIQHESDLVVSASAFFVTDPHASNMQFRAWVRSMHAFERYPELQGFGIAVPVSHSQLSVFAARAVRDPTGPLAANGTYQLVPPGDRPYYCLATAGENREAGQGPPAGFDYCAAGPATVWLAARDSGQEMYIPLHVGPNALLNVDIPLYRGGVVPATVAARRETFLGWVGQVTVPKVVLDRALQGHPGTAVAFRYHQGASNVVFSSGRAPVGAQSVTIDLHNGWSVRTSGAVTGDGVFQNSNAMATLIGGLLMSLLLGVLVFVLGTGRARALRLVGERTAQLRGAQAQLVEAARQGGMAEIATNVLHNVGNVLNSVNVSADMVAAKVRGSKSTGLVRAVALMEQHSGDLGEFLTTDARGKQLPGYLDQLASTLAAERVSLQEELARLTNGVALIKEIVAAQQSLAGVSGVIEWVNVNDLMEDALRMAGVADHDEVSVIRDFPDVEVSLDRHRVLLILLNLISNDTHAMTGNVNLPPQLSLRAEVTTGPGVRFTVADNGEGIPPENLTRIFVHGFTTHTDGHGFGLHGSALAAKEMAGKLTVHSEGAGTGAVFTLEVPLDRQLLRERQLVTA